MADTFTASYRALLPQYFDTEWVTEAGLSRQELAEALSHTPVEALPAALEEFYLSVGAVEELMEAYYFIWDPDELDTDEGYLLFMEDEDERYTWGIPVASLDVPDPLVFRRSEARGEWRSTGATVSEYLLDYFAWVFEEIEPALEENEGRE